MLKQLKNIISLMVFAIILHTTTSSFAASNNNTHQLVDTNIINKNSFVPLYKYLATIIRYPKTARENSTTGAVIVSFKLNTEGNIQNVKVEKSIKDGCDEEVIKALSGFKDKNKELKSGDYKIAVTFRLNGQPVPNEIDPEVKKQPNFLNGIIVTALTQVRY